MKRLTYVEIDVDYCANTYGVAPCTASIPTTGDIKCFNSIATCQDRANFANAPATLRFAMDSAYLPADIDCIPSITSVALTPSRLSLGADLGQRATLTVTFRDHRHSDAGPGLDKYHAERPYDPFAQGTFWGKFRARQPYLRGRPLRLIRGTLGEPLASMETRHYVIDGFDGPRPDGSYALIAKDVLKLADDDRAQAPRASNGFLVAPIDVDDVAATLSPSGIGDAVIDGRAEYPASGWVCIGGNEICAFTRSGDSLTLTRGQFGSVASAHNAEERVQLVLRYNGIDPADIISDLLQTYAGIPSGFIPLANWQQETDAFLQRLYSAVITEPTGVNTLISELVEQAALAVWWDDSAQQVRLVVLRNVAPEATELSADLYLEDTLTSKEQPEKRISQVWTYYGQRDPTKKISDLDNFKSCVLTVDLEAEGNYGSPAIKKIMARWIPEFGRAIASRVNAIQLGRFRIPPRQFTLSLFRDGAPDLRPGGAFNISGWPLQDATGAGARAPIMITQMDPGETDYKVEAEEALFSIIDPADLFDRVIIIDANTLNFNLRAVHDTLYPEIVDPYGITVTVIIQAGVIVGSGLSGAPAFDVGSWVPGVPIKVVVNGRIQGRGGQGGGRHSAGRNGEAGSTALYLRYPVDIEFGGDGQIFGGGGGGAGVLSGDSTRGGGGGQGQLPGPGGEGGGPSGSPGTTEAPGAGAPLAYPGGAAGEPGGSMPIAPFPGQNQGGAAGLAIDGWSYVTVSVGPGDIRGPQVN